MKNIFLSIVLLTSLLVSCKSDEQKKFDELIVRSEKLYQSIQDRPDYLYSNQNFLDPRYLTILDERMDIVRRANKLKEDAKFDDRPTDDQIIKLKENFDKIEDVLKNR
jgi:hypothetical protein